MVAPKEIQVIDNKMIYITKYGKYIDRIRKRVKMVNN
jgi:hypothetical protein